MESVQATPSYMDQVVECHEMLVQLAERRAKDDASIAFWIDRARALEIHVVFGHPNLSSLLREWFGWKPRTFEERERVATALGDLPAIAQALHEHRITQSHVRHLLKVVVPENQQVWLDAVKEQSVRQVQRMVRGRKKGDLPTAPPPPESVHELRARISPATTALLAEVRRREERRHGGVLSDDALFATILRTYLRGRSPRDEDTAKVPPYQVQVTVCRDCDRARVGGHELTPAQLALALCDHDSIDDTAVPARKRRRISDQTRRIVLAWFDGRCAVPGCRDSAKPDLHRIDPQAGRGAHRRRNLVPLCVAHHHAEHDGSLVIRGWSPNHVTFEGPDGTPFAVGRRRAYVRTVNAGRGQTFSHLLHGNEAAPVFATRRAPKRAVGDAAKRPPRRAASRRRASRDGPAA